MKNNIVFSLISICFLGCIYEAPPITHSFNIFNSSDYNLYIESKTSDEFNVQIDTIKPGDVFHKDIKKYYCYEDYYKDSLITALFKVLSISVSSKNVKINLEDRKNWKETYDLQGDNCKRGTVTYEIYVSNEELN